MCECARVCACMCVHVRAARVHDDRREFVWRVFAGRMCVCVFVFGFVCVCVSACVCV